jgi:FkbM family methyltransferase
LGVDLKRYSKFRRAIDLLVSEGTDPFFIQVGANDGILADDLHGAIVQHDLAGIAIEPVPDYFASLQQTYVRQRRVKPLNTALHPSANTATIYRVVPGRAKHQWEHGLASFSRDHLLGHGVAGDAIEEVTVACTTFESILKHVPPQRAVDILMIDTEGFDIEVLRMVDLKSLRPKVIRFESKHIGQEDMARLTRELQSLGYSVLQEEGDCVALTRELGLSPIVYLKRRWRQNVF